MDGVTTVTDRGVPPDVTWWRTPDGTAHAFPAVGCADPSLCTRERFTWPLRAATNPRLKQCPDCALLADGAPGEITEAFGR